MTTTTNAVYRITTAEEVFTAYAPYANAAVQQIADLHGAAAIEDIVNVSVFTEVDCQHCDAVGCGFCGLTGYFKKWLRLR